MTNDSELDSSSAEAQLENEDHANTPIEETKKDSSISFAIIVAGALIAIAIISTDYFKRPVDPNPNPLIGALNQENTFKTTVTRSESRHIYGRLEASTTIVEFSDYRCGYCARVHSTLKQLVDESGGTINWEYRHLPILSTESQRAAVASECIARLAGNEAFWSFTDVIFANQSSLGNDLYTSEALTLGLNETEFATCLTDENIKAVVERDALIAASLGGQGTPFSVVVHQDGLIQPISGALPLNVWRDLLNLHDSPVSASGT